MKALIYLLLIPMFSLSQVVVSIDKDSILIGDQFQLRITSIGNDSLPNLNDSIGSIEILSKSTIDSIVQENESKLTQNYTLTIWNGGTHYIPSFKHSSGITDSIPIVVSAMTLPDSVSLNQIMIKDIKGPMDSPISFDELMPYLIGLFILAIIIFLLIKFIKKQKRQPPVKKVVEPIIPPHQIAIDKLEKLKTQQLWQNGLVKIYYSELSEIIRTYIEHGLGTPAMEIPTNDIVAQLHQKGIDTVSLNELLKLADLAKFAKAMPLEVENKNSYQIALDFIYQTKPTEEKNDLE